MIKPSTSTATAYLNEVLSIRAQEFRTVAPDTVQGAVNLNEVLSIRAQE